MNPINFHGFAQCSSRCTHCELTENVAPPTLVPTMIEKNQCSYCFKTDAHGIGVFICMKCFECLCPDHLPKHRHICGHPIYIKYFRLPRRVKDGQEVSGSNNELICEDVNNLGVVPEPEFDARLVCVDCETFIQDVKTGECGRTFSAIINATPAMAVAGAVGVDAIDTDDPWRNSRACSHAATLVQSESIDRSTYVDMPCAKCPCSKNNWMCMTCGAIGCPRPEAGGQGHAISHFQETGHPLVLKIGTVTPRGADLYCYACDDEVKDSRLHHHLAHFKIDMSKSIKVAKSLGEMAFDITMAADYKSICEVDDGGESKTKPAFGDALAGIYNMGNTCYMNAALQGLVKTDSVTRSLNTLHHIEGCTNNSPRTCSGCQWEKLARGMLSSEFSKPITEGIDFFDSSLCSDDLRARECDKRKMYAQHLAAKIIDSSLKCSKDILPLRAYHDFQELNGITPRDHRRLLARGNQNFLSGLQQDVFEYMGHVFEGFQQESSNEVANLAAPFAFDLVTRSQCIQCQRVRYEKSREHILKLPNPIHPEAYVAADPNVTQEVALADILDRMVSPTFTECRCEGCGATDGGYFIDTHVANCPENLILYIPRQFAHPQTYQEMKMAVSVKLPPTIDLSTLRGPSSLQPGEVSQPTSKRAPSVDVDSLALVTLLSMGIEEKTARWALIEKKNSVDQAIDFVFSNPDGPPQDTTNDDAKEDVSSPPASDGTAKYTVIATVSHIGPHAHSGHYVAHAQQNVDGKKQWIIFNDDKVGYSNQPPLHLASLYFLERCRQ